MQMNIHQNVLRCTGVIAPWADPEGGGGVGGHGVRTPPPPLP